MGFGRALDLLISCYIALFGAAYATGKEIKPESRLCCGITEAHLRKTTDVVLEALVAYDPGEQVMLDADNCKYHDMSCVADGKDSIVSIPLSCKLLHYFPNTPRHKTQTGKTHSFTIRIRVTPEGKMTILK